MTPPDFWTPDRIAELRKRWDANETGRQIAKAMGCSRDDVLTKARRLGLPSRRPSVRWKAAPSIADLIGSAS